MLLTEEELFEALEARFPGVKLRAGNRFRCHIWGDDKKTYKMEIEYNSFCTSFATLCTGLLHEFGHYMDDDLWHGKYDKRSQIRRRGVFDFRNP